MDIERIEPVRVAPGGPGLPGSGDVLERRAAVHRALGDVHRLAIVDALQFGDRGPSELAALTGLASNLLAFHLDVLDEAGLITRSVSEGDARRRYVRLHRDAVLATMPSGVIAADDVLFVCTANSARSQLAAALWERATGCPARSAGHRPAASVHPLAVEVAARHGLSLADRHPTAYEALDHAPDLIVSVCDRAREAGLPFDVPTLHWSIPDPVGGGPDQLTDAFVELAARVGWLASRRRGAA